MLLCLLRQVMSAQNLPPLSLSILGVEPLDEFIQEVADFIHYQIKNRPHDVQGSIEVEAKIGLLREKGAGGGRIWLPVLTETSMCVTSTSLDYLKAS
jgi:polynucleotide 5'-triphosphatase